MKRDLLVVFLLLAAHFVHAATPFQVRRDHVKVFTAPDFKNAVPATEYFYGDTLSVNIHNAKWAEITLQDGSRGYVKKENLLLATDGFGKLSAEEKIATPLYKITSATLVFCKPDNGSERISLPFRNHQILYDAVPVNNEWMSIPIGGGEKGYVRRLYLNEISHEEKVAMFGQAPPQSVENNKVSEKLTEYIDGVKTGRRFVIVIVAVCILLLLETIYRYNRGPLRGKSLGLYAHTLLVMSLLEIWYFYSLGMKEVFWFLSFDHILSTILYVTILIVFTWIQLASGLNLIDDTVKASARKKRKYLWIALGVISGLLISYLYREIAVTDNADHRFGPDTVICQIIGQLPAGILFARNLKKRLQSKKILFCLYYMVIAGSVVSLIMGSILIFVVFAALFALGVARPDNPEPEGPQINSLCYSCRYFCVHREECALEKDIMASSCSHQKDR